MESCVGIDDGKIDVADVQRLAVEVFGALIGERSTDLIVAPAKGVLADWRSP